MYSIGTTPHKGLLINLTFLTRSPTAEASVSLEGPPKKKLKSKATADPESYYEERVRKSGGRDGEAGSGAGSFSVDPVDALPIKTLEGQLMYRRSQGPISGKREATSDVSPCC